RQNPAVLLLRRAPGQAVRAVAVAPRRGLRRRLGRRRRSRLARGRGARLWDEHALAEARRSIERVQEVAHRREAVLGALGQAALEDAPLVRGDAVRVVRRGGLVLLQHLPLGVAAEWDVAGQALVEDHAERVDIALLVPAPLQHLG